MSILLGLFRFNVQIPDSGIMRVVAGASVTVYSTMNDGTAPVTNAGIVNVSAVKSTIYSDRSGSATLANPIISDAQGLIEFFAPIGNYHLQVTTLDNKIFGVPWQAQYRDPTVDAKTFINVMDYPTVQAAFDDISTQGATVYFPAKVYNSDTRYPPCILDTITIPSGINRITIRGDGPQESVISMTVDANTDLFDFAGIEHVTIKDCQLAGFASAGTGRGLPLSHNNHGYYENVYFANFASYALEIIDTGVYDGSMDSVLNTFQKCRFTNSRSNFNVKLTNRSFFSVFNQCLFDCNTAPALSLVGNTQNTFNDCTFEGQWDTSPIVQLDAVVVPQFKNCWFELHGTNQLEYFISSTGTTVQIAIEHCHFVRNAVVTGARIFKTIATSYLTGSITDAFVQIGGNVTGTDDIKLVGTDALRITNCMKAKSSDIAGTLTYVRVNVTSPNYVTMFPNNNRIKLQPIDTAGMNGLPDPREGDIVYNTTAHALYHYTGSAWAAV